MTIHSFQFTSKTYDNILLLIFLLEIPMNVMTKENHDFHFFLIGHYISFINCISKIHGIEIHFNINNPWQIIVTINVKGCKF